MLVKKLVVAALLVGFGASCDSTVEVANSVPRVTWVAVSAPVNGVADITVWISDIEGDPVDLALNWRLAGESSEGQAITQGDGGHGVSGLTTHLETFDPNGQPHLIRWDVSALSGQVQLRFVPKDADASGAAALSPAFDVGAGLPDAVEVVAEP